MKQELVQLTKFQWDNIMAEYHIRIAHDYFMEIFIRTPEKSKAHLQAASIIKRLNNIHINFEAVLQLTDPKWGVEDQDNANARMRGAAEVDAFMYTANEQDRKEILDLITKRTLARANKFKENAGK